MYVLEKVYADGKKDEPDVKVKSIFCFTADPEMREKGIAAQLLRRVCDDAATDGFDFIEAYQNKEFINTAEDFMGTVGIYEKADFEPCYEAGSKLVVRKKLKG